MKIISLYDYVKFHEADYDTYDDTFDAIVTVCFIDTDDELDDYDRFCIELMKKVDVVGTCADGDPIVNWSKLVTDNMNKFREFSKKYWSDQYDDDDVDDFVYNWITEFHSYIAGYVPDDFYKILLDFVYNLD